MKKYLIIGLSIISSLFLVDNVKAETFSSEYVDSDTNNIYTYDKYVDLGYEEYFKTIINHLWDEYTTKYASEYPYYYFNLSYVSSDYISVGMGIGKSSNDLELEYRDDLSDYRFVRKDSNTVKYYASNYTFKDGGYYTFTDDVESFVDTRLFGTRYIPISYFISNFSLYNDTDITFNVTGLENFTINPGDLINPVYSSYEDFINGGKENKLTEVDLNSYPYIILSLKDYSKTEEFSTINYVKGQYCLTSVYNYGSTEKKDIIEGSKTKRCSLYYDNYTPIRTYILNSDLKNNAIYYLKAYDTTKENKVKIDTSVFNIHYISEEEKDNPIITINGKKHTPKSYDELTDTATKSEDENYADGASEKFTFSDIFTAPLEFLKTIWNSITQFFQVINQFISLLPETLQAFLYMSFMLAIILGLIKIIL